MRPLSLHHLTMIDAHPLHLIEAAAAGGFSHCGIRLVAPRPGDPLVDVLAEAGAVRAIRRRLNEAGVALLDIEAIWIGPETDVTALAPALEAGAELGARHVLVVGNDPDRARLCGNLAALCGMAAPLGLRLMLEFISYCSVNSLDSAVACIRAAQQPNLGLLIDALQFFRADTDPKALAAHDPALFSYVQICDAPRAAPATLEARRHEARHDRRLPGQGELPLRALLAALPADLPLSLEVPGAALRGLPAPTLGRRAGDALRAFLAGHDPAGPTGKDDI